MNAHRFALPVLAAVGILIAGCSAKRIAMQPSSETYHDVFACRGLTEDNKWVGVTDQFDPETDPRVVVVAVLGKDDREKTLHYELTNPQGNVAMTEKRIYPRQNILGIYFEVPRLMQIGGEGEWQANVFADGLPIGQANFVLGEKKEGEDEEGGRQYYVVGADSDETEDAMPEGSEAFESYIREVTPEADIPREEIPMSNPRGDSGSDLSDPILQPGSAVQ